MKKYIFVAFLYLFLFLFSVGLFCFLLMKVYGVGTLYKTIDGSDLTASDVGFLQNLFFVDHTDEIEVVSFSRTNRLIDIFQADHGSGLEVEFKITRNYHNRAFYIRSYDAPRKIVDEGKHFYFKYFCTDSDSETYTYNGSVALSHLTEQELTRIKSIYSHHQKITIDGEPISIVLLKFFGASIPFLFFALLFWLIEISRKRHEKA